MLKFWTAQYRYPGPFRLDITVKGQDVFGKYFAPTWGMLNEYRKICISKEEREQNYIKAYHQIIMANEDYMKRLLAFDERVLVCFCAADVFCHRHLLSHYLQLRGATYMGEITDFKPWISQQAIDDFHSPKFEFLSNFYESPFIFQGILYKTVEHFYQAWKFPINQRKTIANLATPGHAKRAGRKAELPANWETIKVDIMREGLRQKFSNPDLGFKLVNLGTATLIEGNYWHDNFWGRCTCASCRDHIIPAKNMLGQLLMELRTELREQYRKEKGL